MKYQKHILARMKKDPTLQMLLIVGRLLRLVLLVSSAILLYELINNDDIGVDQADVVTAAIAYLFVTVVSVVYVNANYPNRIAK